MNIDVVDVRLDERKLPYLVSETVAEYRGEYVGEQRLKVNSLEKVVNVLNNVFHMKDFSEEKLYVMFLSASLHVIAYAEVSHGVIDPGNNAKSVFDQCGRNHFGTQPSRTWKYGKSINAGH